MGLILAFKSANSQDEICAVPPDPAVIGDTAQSPPQEPETPKNPHAGSTVLASNCNAPVTPLSEFFKDAADKNDAFYQEKQKQHEFCSPIFKLVQIMKGHPDMKDRTAQSALKRLNEVNPDWWRRFPDTEDPTAEFIQLWKQVQFADGVDYLATAGEQARRQPVKLLEPISEGYTLYVSIALQLQSLQPKKDIMLPVGPLSLLLTDRKSV